MNINSWNGQLENTSVQFDFCIDTDKTIAVTPIDSIKSVYDAEYIKADKLDYLVAASSGMLTALIDVLWVREFSLRYAQDVGTEQIEKLVIAIAKEKGCKKEDIKGCIGYLEDKYPMAADKVTNDFGGGLQHHLRDFSHHASPFGLICSILNQFTRKCYGTDTEGKIITPGIPETDTLGNTFEEKIMFGVVGWAFHLISDMAGSSGSSGRGIGIPGPLLSLAKVLSTTPLFHDLKVQYKGDDIAFSAWVSKLFNGTAFEHTSNKDLIRFDLRTELGISNFAVKQSVPVIINQCIVRSFYFIRRLAQEYSEKKISSLADCKQLEYKKILPFNNRCIVRMITIATGTFSVVDSADAVIRAKLRNPKDNVKTISDTLLRLNFVGIGAFAFSIKNEVKYVAQDVQKFMNKKTKAQMLLEQRAQSEDVFQSIDIEVDMDNSELYEYAFGCMYNHVKKCKDDMMQAQNVMLSMQRPVVVMSDGNTQLYNAVTKMSRHSLIVETEELVMRLFILNNVSYEPFEGDEKYSKYMPFVRIEYGKRIAYHFSSSLTERINGWEQLQEKYNLDGIKVVALVEVQGDKSTLNSIVNNEIRLTGGFVTYETIESVFALLGEDEYRIYKKYCDRFNNSVRELIGYSTVTIPSVDMLHSFKMNTADVIKKFDYQKYVPELFSSQADIIKHNFFERELYRIIFGDSDLAESFLSSEWYFSMHTVTSGLEQTAIVAGYLKSIEQLLYKIVCLSINTGKEIKEKDSREYIEYTSENASRTDITLGSLIGYVKHYPELWDVNKFSRYYIADKLAEYRKTYRNDHFHKDNVYDIKEIKEIREHTIVLFYLLLGGCSISDNQVSEFDLYYETSDAQESLKYDQLENWLNRILGGDILLDGKIPIYFMFKNYGQTSWELQFNTVKGFNEKLLPDDMKYPYVCDSLYWPALLDEQEAERDVIQFLMSYLKNGKYAAKLKGHSLIAVGRFGHHQIIYENRKNT
jgi:hypothetical protein